MKALRDEATVLRTQDLGEADRTVTLLSVNSGPVRAVTHGVRETTSQIGTCLEPFRVVDVLVRPGRGGLHNVERIETLAPYGHSTAADYTLFTTANLMIGALERLNEEAWTAGRYYRLTLGALYALAFSRHEPGLVLDSYLLWLLGSAEWTASYWNCATYEANRPHQYFNPAIGGAMCGEYKPHGAAPVALKTMHLLATLSVGDWPRAEVSRAAGRAGAHSLVMAFVQWHMECRLKSLAILEIA